VAPPRGILPAVSADINAAQAFGKLNGGGWTLEMATPSTILATPLAALHATAGREDWRLVRLRMPDNFGDEAAEYRYARDTVALIDKNYRAYLASPGPTASATEAP